MTAPRCAWCGVELSPRARADSKFCGQRCRQRAWRLSEQLATDVANGQPKRLGYADPPFVGLAGLYKDQPTYAGEVNHRELLASLQYSYDGWALSCSVESLRELLPMCPEGVRVCAWCKPNGVSKHTRGLHNTWEALIVSPARRLRPGFRDFIVAKPARRGGTLIGRKPLAFCAWLFRCLGAVPAIDTLDDLYPGTGIVGRAWAYASLLQRGDASPVDALDGWAAVAKLEQRQLPQPSPTTSADMSLSAGADASPTAERDASPRAARKTRRSPATREELARELDASGAR